MSPRYLHASIAFIVLAAVMGLTRVHHFSAVPDASWAVFLVGGYVLGGFTRFAFPALMVLAIVIDYVVIRASGLDFWTHYCVSPGYWMLVPAYFSLWWAGSWVASSRRPLPVRALEFALALVGGVALCHLLAQGGFYWLSNHVVEPSLAGWWKNYTDWLWPYLRTTALYVLPLAVIEAVRLVRGRPAFVVLGRVG